MLEYCQNWFHVKSGGRIIIFSFSHCDTMNQIEPFTFSKNVPLRQSDHTRNKSFFRKHCLKSTTECKTSDTHSVKIQDFFCQVDFTWNWFHANMVQIHRNKNCQNDHVSYISRKFLSNKKILDFHTVTVGPKPKYGRGVGRSSNF